LRRDSSGVVGVKVMSEQINVAKTLWLAEATNGPHNIVQAALDYLHIPPTRSFSKREALANSLLVV